MKELLEALAPISILVGSASREKHYNDIDLVVGYRGLIKARSILPKPWESIIPGHIKTFETSIPLEVFRDWWGPSYRELRQRKALVEVDILGVKFRAWTKHPEEWDVLHIGI